MDVNLQYNEKQLKKDIVAVGKKLNTQSKRIIAMQEGLTYPTVDKYFGGKIVYYAVAKALIEKGTNIINCGKDDN